MQRGNRVGCPIGGREVDGRDQHELQSRCYIIGEGTLNYSPNISEQDIPFVSTIVVHYWDGFGVEYIADRHHCLSEVVVVTSIGVVVEANFEGLILVVLAESAL
jgi:hypothetical protein